MAPRPSGSVRVIAGRWRGRLIPVPPGLSIRPTGDRAREGLFSILGPGIESAAVADLFCGTGALGLEALSRGARRVVAVDSDPRAVRALRTVAVALGATLAEHTAIRDDVLRWLRSAPVGEPFDVVIADPPWQRQLGDELTRLLAARPWVRPGGLVVIEREVGRDVESSPQGDIIPVRTARYGRTLFELFRRATPT